MSASGWLGRGDRVTVLVRDVHGKPGNAPPVVETVIGDLEDAALLERHARDADAVLHLALAPGPRAGEVDHNAVAAFRRALAGSGKPFVHTSAAGIIGDTQGQVVDEQHTPQPPPPVRWRAENEAFALDAARQDTRVMVIRPAPIVHDRDHPGAVVEAMRRSVTGPVPYVEGGTRRWSTVHVEDVADLYVAVLDRGAAGEAYFAASEELVTNQQLAGVVANGGPTRAVGLEEARSLFSFFADLARTDIMVSGAKARSQVGWTPQGTLLLDELRTDEEGKKEHL